MQGFLMAGSAETEILLALSIILFAGFIMTRLTNTLNLPKVSGYILAGILIGPCGLDMIPQDMINDMGFISDLALAFIAFGVGKFFKKEVIVKTGSKVLIVTFFEALTAGVLVTLFSRMVFGLDLDFALILGAIATATAPASTMMTINQYKAKGEFVNTLLQIVALDDVVCLLTFSIISAIAGAADGGALTAGEIMLPLVYNIFALLLGFFCGYFLSRLLIPTRSKDNRLILAIAMLTGISGICTALDISPLLSCMVFGMSYINLTRDKKLYRQLNNFSPPVMSLFFIVSGMKLDINALKTVGVIGIAYFTVRIIGKYVGTYVGCLVTGMSKEARNYMGLALVPQAGVAIGLAFLGERLLPGERGQLLLTIILSSSVLYEMVGPVCAKLALIFSGCISPEKVAEAEADAAAGEQMAVDLLSGDMEAHEEIGENPVMRTESMDAESMETESVLMETDDREEMDEPKDAIEGGKDGALAPEEVSLVEHLEELEMGVENQETFDIEREVAPDKKEAVPEKKTHDNKSVKHKKKKSRRKR
ncbi:MAG: cation:proton antiporter [Clostridium sp.]|nr:cation:proton antiporter [Clostridium sp.]